MLKELMAPENHYLFIALIGIDCYGGLTARELEEIRSNLPNDVGGDIVRYALTRLGDPYSKTLRGTGRYVDCSYLVRWAYNQVGVTSYRASTAAEQARYCVNNHMTISKSQLTGRRYFLAKEQLRLWKVQGDTSRRHIYGQWEDR